MTILQKIENIATGILTSKLPENLFYHDYVHTREVVRSCVQIGHRCGLSERELELVQIAAWLHDTGHIYSYWQHEDASVLIGLQVLYSLSFSLPDIGLVLGCIEATKLPQKPKNLMEKVLCDADLAHLAADNFQERSALLRLEWAMVLKRSYSDEDWRQINIGFFQKQEYFTIYGQQNLGPRQAENLQKLQYT